MSEPAEDSAETTERKVRAARRSRPVLWGRSATDLIIVAVAVASGISGALASGQPTGTPGVDLVMRFTFAFAVAFITPRARRWTWLVLAGVALAASGANSSAIPAALGLAVAFAATFVPRRRWLGAIVGALAVWSLLRLPTIGQHGVTALIAAAAILPVVVSAYTRERRKVRRRIRYALGATAALVVVAVGLLGVAGLSSADQLDRGVDEARAGIASAKAGDQAATDQHLTAASSAFADANATLESWMTKPARLVPVVGQHAEALGTMSGLGRDLARLALATTSEADYRGLVLDAGRVDLPRIVALEAPLQAIDDGLAQAREESATVHQDWLVGPLRERHRTLDEEITTTRDEVALALEAVRIAPGLLGADGPRRYFIAFTTPAESRGLGGFMGNWAELTAIDGSLDITRDGRIADLLPTADEPGRTLDAPADYLDRYGPLHPETFPGDVTFSPDFPSVAQAIDSIYGQVPGGAPIDGVIAIDPYGLAAMLEITGPITVEGLDQPLTAANAADYLLRGQYLEYETKNERTDVLDRAARATFDAFIHSGNLKPLALASVLGPAVAEGRVFAFSTRPDEQSFLTRIGLDGAFPPAGDQDFFSVITQNAGNNKIDVYLHRTIDYRVSLEPTTGAIDATALVTLRNDAPSTGLPDYVILNRGSSDQPPGTNWTWFNFYSPHELVSMSIDGQPLPAAAKREFGVYVYSAYVAVPSQSEITISVHLAGQITPTDDYRLDWHQQPLTNPDEVTVFLAVSPPWYVDDPDAEPGTIPLISTEPQLAVTSRQSGGLDIPLREVQP